MQYGVLLLFRLLTLGFFHHLHYNQLLKIDFTCSSTKFKVGLMLTFEFIALLKWHAV